MSQLDALSQQNNTSHQGAISQQVQSRDSHYLNEMGISQWTLSQPQILEGFQLPSIDLSEDCKLLLVSTVSPSGEIVTMFERVLKSIHLKLEQVLFIQPEQFAQLGLHQLEWVWFAGCPAANEHQVKKILTSPLLSDIDGNTQHRRALWQQICSYD